ncbi:HNH endonuclease [Nocardia mangyaensis]|uniref:HNH endonuclease n=1 Tax=Nocardia mangyaensis TaxID=2213200 RepID=UPI002676DC60|nr:HNH endonuclease [Nocardia mangyaensis]MDO3647862.1 HNH endonuclease [Nocardia mangyaensis]
MARVTHDLTDAQWDALGTAWGGCAYCGSSVTSLQKDCVQAISRGGRYTLGNVVPACGSCNSSKCNAEVTGWLRRKKLDERAFLLRHYEISTELANRFARLRESVAEGTCRTRDLPTAQTTRDEKR